MDGDHTFTAVWAENKTAAYTVTFDANGHGTAPAAQSVEEGKTAAKPADPTAAGYVFGGWFTDKKCTNAFDFNTPIKQNITLYAKWTASAAAVDANKVEGAKTGDSSHVVIWAVLLGAAVVCLLAALLIRKRYKRN